MSVLFPKVNKPREWDYRPRYYDEKKEARKQRLARLQHKDGEKAPYDLDFRSQHEKNMSKYTKTGQVSRLSFWVALLLMLIAAYYLLNHYGYHTSLT